MYVNRINRMLGIYKEQAPKMNMLYKLIPSGLFKTRLRDRKNKNRQIQAAPSFNIEDVDISHSNNEKRSRRHSKSKYDSEINMAGNGKTVVTSSLLLYEGRKNIGILLREESPLLDTGRLRVVSIGSSGPATSTLLLPDFLLDVNLKLINTNNSFASTEDLWSYNPEEGHTSGARKAVHFS